MSKSLIHLFLVALCAVPTITVAQENRVSCAITTQNLNPTGAATGGSACQINGPIGTLTATVRDTYTGALSIHVTSDGVVWTALGATTTVTRDSTGVTSATITSGQTGNYSISGVTGKYAVRISADAAVTGSPRVTLNAVPFGGGGGSAGTVSGGTDGVEQGSTTSGQSGPLAQGAVTTGAPTYTDGQTSPISLTTAGALRTTATLAGTAHDAAAAAVDPVLTGCYGSAAAPSDVSATNDAVRAWCLLNGARAVQPTMGGVLAVAGNGVSGTGVQRVTIASDSTGTIGVTATGGVGSLTEAAPASDTASSGLNGRLQRIAQNLTTLNTSVNTDPTTAAPVAPGAAAATKSMLMGCQNASAGVTFTDGQQGRVSCGANGRVLADTSLASSAAVTLTRTADTNAYTANDVLGAATGSTAALTFTSMCPISAGRIMLTSVSIQVNDTAVISGETSYRLYLYNVTPPSALGDNAAFDLPSGDRASYLGYVDLGTVVDLGSTLFVQSTGVNRQVTCAGTSLFGYLVTTGAYTPSSARVYVVTLNAVGL